VGLPFERTWLKDSSRAIGVHLLAGLEYPIFKSLFLGCEIKYSYVEGSWELENQNTGEVTEIKNLNIGGTSIRLGLNYKF
jgi:opacity protein-like surface antigen